MVISQILSFLLGFSFFVITARADVKPEGPEVTCRPDWISAYSIPVTPDLTLISPGDGSYFTSFRNQALRPIVLPETGINNEPGLRKMKDGSYLLVIRSFASRLFWRLKCEKDHCSVGPLICSKIQQPDFDSWPLANDLYQKHADLSPSEKCGLTSLALEQAAAKKVPLLNIEVWCPRLAEPSYLISGFVGPQIRLIGECQEPQGKDKEIFNWIAHRPTQVSATSTLAPQKGNNYGAENLIDGKLSTAWVEGEKDLGIGTVIDFQFDPPVHLDQVLLAPGYQKDDLTFLNNSTPLRFEIQEEIDGKRTSQKSPKLSDPEPGYFQLFNTFSAPNETAKFSRFRLKILAAHPGRKFRDTAISEVVFLELPALRDTEEVQMRRSSCLKPSPKSQAN